MRGDSMGTEALLLVLAAAVGPLRCAPNPGAAASSVPPARSSRPHPTVPAPAIPSASGVPRLPASASTPEPTCSLPRTFGFERWADAGATVSLLDGATLASDGVSVAIEHAGALIQDGALTATQDCEAGDRFAGFAGRYPSDAWARVTRGGKPLSFRLGERGWRVSRASQPARVIEPATAFERLRADPRVQELPPPPGSPVAFGIGGARDVWAVVAGDTVTDARCSATPSGAPASYVASNLWRFTADHWTNVLLPKDAGKVLALAVRAPDDVWVTTERAVFRSKPPSRMLRWSNGGHCPLPITGAKPYTYHAVPSSQLLVTRPNNLVGSDCPHFMLVDSTSEPSSRVFDQARAVLENASMFADGVRAAEASYDAVLAGVPGAEGSSPSPLVSFELGSYYWGFRAEPLVDEPRVASLLRAHFPHELRELCAAPLPIRVEVLTKSSVAARSR